MVVLLTLVTGAIVPDANHERARPGCIHAFGLIYLRSSEQCGGLELGSEMPQSNPYRTLS
jgi:hypothetical protein